jgi:hypothetical protein
MSKRRWPIFAVVLIIGITGCCFRCPSVDSQQKLIMQFDDYMIPLSKAVDAIADRLPQDAKDQEIFSEVVKKSGNPLLLKPFEGYTLKARLQDGIGIILLCSPDGKEGIIEDVSCTTRPDSHRPTGSPCTYLLNPKLVCAAP